MLSNFKKQQGAGVAEAEAAEKGGRWEAAQTPKGHLQGLGLLLGGAGNQNSVSSREAARSELYFKSLARSPWLLPGHKHKRARVGGRAEAGGSNLGPRSGIFFNIFY